MNNIFYVIFPKQKLCTVGQRDLVNSAVAATPRDEAKQSSFHCFVYSLLCCGSVCDQINKDVIAIGIFCFVQIQLMPDFLRKNLGVSYPRS